MIIFEYLGQCLTQEKITPGNTATSLTSGCYNYTEWDLPFDSGGTTEIVAGDWLVGATGTGRCTVVSVGTLTSGTWAGGTAAGTFRVKSMHGTAFVDNEVLNKVGVDCATVNGTLKMVPADYDYKGMQSKAAFVINRAQTVLISPDGSTPDQSSLVGLELTAGENLTIKDINWIKKLKAIDRVSGSASTISIFYYF